MSSEYPRAIQFVVTLTPLSDNENLCEVTLRNAINNTCGVLINSLATRLKTTSDLTKKILKTFIGKPQINIYR